MLSALLFLGLVLVMNFGGVAAANSTNVVIHTNTLKANTSQTNRKASTITKTLTSTQAKKTVAVNMYGLSNAQILIILNRVKIYIINTNK